MLTPAGRPVEFHCTAPVKPNRAQQILYGPTLESYLFGEQIGQTLVTKSSVGAGLVLTNCEPALAVRDHIDVPVAWVRSNSESENTPKPRAQINGPPESSSVPTRGPLTQPTSQFQVAGQSLAMRPDDAEDQVRVVDMLRPIVSNLDLSEPFQRIHDAINEAQRAA